MMAQAPISTIDITTDNSYSGNLAGSTQQDPHVQSYDCFGSISLNSVMQSNVPTPFGGMHKFSHLNMPGGQWSQEYKFTSQNLHSSHYSALRDSARADWGTYDQNVHFGATTGRRSYSTHSAPPTSESPARPAAIDAAPTEAKLSKKDKLKQAFKEYGTTIIAFHVGISLISLGGFYLLVSSGINLVPVLEFLGITSVAIAEKVATGSTFVVAYAVHKVFAPARISITLGSTPFIVRFLRSKGFLKSKPKST
ncbi:blast:Protein FAM210B [Drosophila guanche]|nr:blast:Protein FAM210B [Drosophila guanche]